MQKGKFFAVAIVIIFAGCDAYFYPENIFLVSPEILGYYDLPQWPQKIFVSNKYAYVADNNSGLMIIDISNPYLIRERGHLDKVNVHDIYVSGKYAYIADFYQGLRVIDISNPSLPSIIASYYVSTRPYYIHGIKKQKNIAGRKWRP